MNRSVTMLALFAAGMTCTALGNFTFVEVERTSCADCMKTYRFYARFDDPTDELLAVGGVPREQPFSFTASHPLFNDQGSLVEPAQQDFARSPLSHPRDSWLTIGSDQAVPNLTLFSNGFLDHDGVNPVVVGDTLFESNGSWFHNGGGVAGERTLIAQLSFAADPVNFTISGTVAYQIEGVGSIQYGFFNLFYSETKSQCPADLDFNDTVGFDDLLVVLANWGPCSGDCCPGDVDNTGEVDFDDLLGVLSGWGDC